MHRADHDSLIALRPFFQHGVEMVLLAQLAHHVRTAVQADFAQPPVTALQVQQPVGDQRLMRPVERPEADMHNAALQAPAIISRLLDSVRKRSGGNSFHECS